MEFLVVVAVGILLFILVRALLQRQAQRMNERLKDAVTPENARMAAKTLTDEQHKEVYRAIAADDGRQALAVFRQATGAKIQDCIVAVQALHAYPQPTPSELHLEDDTTSAPDIEGMGAEAVDASGSESATPDDVASSEQEPTDADDSVRDEYVEDVIDGVDESSETADSDDAPAEEGETDAETETEAEQSDDVDAAARRLMEESGFDQDAELTVPTEWTEEPQDDLGGFHLEVQRGDEKISLSHEDLEPWVHDQLYALVRNDELEQASELLAAHSPLTQEEAHKFLVVFRNQE
ncbi:hypothetical protein [Nesterenkonia marinintestina]|uniref:hypothetical protein n=1 Tax=Nesterenkonia marinintestina TaxID=2979865 RepID=UPI0021C039BA|nr:hypothetical protein [Nesterenkonia sp. GX14115]